MHSTEMFNFSIVHPM